MSLLIITYMQSGWFSFLCLQHRDIENRMRLKAFELICVWRLIVFNRQGKGIFHFSLYSLPLSLERLFSSNDILSHSLLELVMQLIWHTVKWWRIVNLALLQAHFECISRCCEDHDVWTATIPVPSVSEHSLPSTLTFSYTPKIVDFIFLHH